MGLSLFNGSGNRGENNPLAVVFLAAAILFALSMLPWGRLTGNLIKDFDLFGDIFPSSKEYVFTELPSDPMLEEFLAEETASDSEPLVSTADSMAAVLVENVPQATEAPRVGNTVAIEDYSPSLSGASALKRALAGGIGRPARIAFIGDSFIEADIFCQNVRALLQDIYGGSGVGYVGMYSEFPGFRQSVSQSGSGWTEKNIMHAASSDTLRFLSGQYYIGTSGATATFKGTKQSSHTSSWDVSRFVFIAPSGGNITLSGSSGAVTMSVEPSDSVQSVVLPGTTSSLSVSCDISGLVGLGVYLDASSGVAVDCMSLRGNSGVGHRKTSPALAAQLVACGLGYDMIVLEYGLNVLSGEQTNYESYGRAMTQTVRRLRACYPGADIMILGIGDRGCKLGTDIVSMPTCGRMTEAQRSVARKTGVMFWDMRAAMGGENAVVDWRRRNLVNADFVHINHAGGKELAKEFVDALKLLLAE